MAKKYAAEIQSIADSVKDLESLPRDDNDLAKDATFQATLRVQRVAMCLAARLLADLAKEMAADWPETKP